MKKIVLFAIVLGLKITGLFAKGGDVKAGLGLPNLGLISYGGQTSSRKAGMGTSLFLRPETNLGTHFALGLEASYNYWRGSYYGLTSAYGQSTGHWFIRHYLQLHLLSVMPVLSFKTRIKNTTPYIFAGIGFHQFLHARVDSYDDETGEFIGRGNPHIENYYSHASHTLNYAWLAGAGLNIPVRKREFFCEATFIKEFNPWVAKEFSTGVIAREPYLRSMAFQLSLGLTLWKSRAL